MKIPLKYNLRSLWVRKLSTAMTAFGIGLTVAVVLFMLALIHGLDSTFVQTGHENHLVLIRQGSQNETASFFDRAIFESVRLLDGIKKDAKGQPLASGEIAVIINHERTGGDTANVLVRGVSPVAFDLRPEVQIIEGRRLRGGVRELMVSQTLSKRFKGMKVGDKIQIAASHWPIVGMFEASGTAYDSEIWADYNDVAQEWNRPIYSCIVLAATDAQAAAKLRKRIEDDRRISLEVHDQKEYYQAQTQSSVALKALGVVIAVVLGIGSCFAAMNMMYAAVMGRVKEVATLRALGFPRFSILTSFMVESIILALIAGVLGCLLALPLNGMSTGTMNFMTFSEVAFNFRLTPKILGQGLLFSLTVGIVGGFLPARRAARLKLIDVMRD